ncbi:phosphoenolpyruvate--protein phosphotransferase [Egicoccus sp. AB-alg2]|uniref:phosphoenolpyruvate--protein phosphotransferase n=1 Tax=Egicoccus sp. AB-alg2 TaxID=3242693 RepID=UPI00359F11CB
MSTLTGRAAAPGVALAPTFRIEPPAAAAPVPSTRTGPVDDEVARLDAALATARAQLEELAERVAAAVGEEEGEIFEAHAEFAADPELRSQAVQEITAGASAERGAITAFDRFRELLRGSSSELLAARATDLDDVRDRVVALLQGRDVAVPVPPTRSVVVAEELTPSQTASLPRELIAALVTETGSPTSHAAILARSLGIPAVVAVDGLLAAVADGDELAVDGRTGEVVVRPDPDHRAAVTKRLAEEDQRRTELAALRDEPGRTADGRHVEVAANIGSADDLPVAVEAGAQGSGLVRTEFLFQDRRTAPSVADQVGFYTQVLRAFPGHRVVFRTMDVGADKPLPFVHREPEENPALGLRGIRLHLSRAELLHDQLRALLRAKAQLADGSAGRLAVMFPLVSVVDELRRARAALEQVAAEEDVDLADVEVGVMVEVPSAALGADRLAAHADFLSIGTNDLLQYLFAADRLQAGVAHLADVCHPDVLALIGRVVAAGHAQGAWVGVCGEAASDPTVAAALVGLGVDELSMTRVAIPEVKDRLRRLTTQQCADAVAGALDEAEDGAGVRAYLEAALTEA